MSIFNRVAKDVSQMFGTLMGNSNVRNMQNATNEAVDSMRLFQSAVKARQNVDFTQAKGNLFEYIEAAKFNTKAASADSNLRAVVTEAVGRPHDPADIEIIKNGRVVRQVQAKFSDSKRAAADSVNMQRKEKYFGMQRLIRKDEHYTDTTTGEQTSLLKRSKDLAKKAASREGNIYQKQYQDVYDNLTDELQYDNVASGGTTLEEVRQAYNSPEQYATAFERKQEFSEMRCTAASMAQASFITTGVASAISNMFQMYNDEKNFAEALKDVGAEAIEGGIRGGATGALSTAIRYHGLKKGSQLLSDSTAATIIAGGVIDGGVSLYSYAKGEITAEELRDQLIDTTAKSTVTVYFSKAVGAIMGSVANPILPMAVYTTSSFVVTCTREIIQSANLAAQEYDRLAALLEESTRQAEEYHRQFSMVVANCEERQRKMMNDFIDTFEYNLETGENYDQALMSITQFAKSAGFALQHVDFDDFSSAMRSDEVFRLE